MLEIPPSYTVFINGEETSIAAQFVINGQAAQPGQLLHDGDEIISKETRNLGEVLNTAGFPPMGKKVKYTLNDKESQYTISPKILLNDNPANLTTEVHQQDYIEYIAPELPKLGDVLNVSELDASLVIYYEGQEHKIPSATVSLEVNGHPATPNTLIADGSNVRFMKSLRAATTVSDALLAVGFQPPAAKSRVNFTILVNKQPVNFTDPIKNGDELAVVISEHDSSKPFMDSGTASGSTAASAAVNLTGANEKRTMTPEAIRDSIRLADKINSIPGLSEALKNNRF